MILGAISRFLGRKSLGTSRRLQGPQQHFVPQEASGDSGHKPQECGQYADHLIEYEYDGEGRQRFRRDLDTGTTSPGEKRTVEQIWQADGSLAERKATAIDPDSTEQRSTFGYDADGNMTSVATYAGGSSNVNVSQITATSTSAGELETLSETIFGPTTSVNGETVISNFDWAQDGLLKQRETDGKATDYTHQLNGLEETVKPFADPIGSLGTLTNTWLPNGSLANVVLPNGSTIEHTFDDAGRTTDRIVKNSSGTKLSSWESIGWDDNDNRTGETVTQRQVDGSSPAPGTATYGYDVQDRLVSAKHPFELETAGYELDDAGNIITETGNPADTGEFTYSFTDNRLITRTPTDPSGAASGYAYDHFGNQTTETKGSELTTNTYDAASQPDETSGPEGTVDYGYDGLGRMVWRISDTPAEDDKTLFFHDGLGQQITVETDEDGDRLTRYLLDSSGSPLGQEQIEKPDPEEDPQPEPVLRRSYFVTDPRGNLTQLLSQAQQIRAVFAYDPFGKPKEALTEVTANWDSRLRFQMAPKDAATGNYNLGARLMNPDINRFIGADNYVGAAANVALQVDPLTGNRYMYAGANPAGMIDDGHRCKQITSSWTWGNCEDDTNAFVSGGRDAVKVANVASGWLATGASFVAVVCLPCGTVMVPLAGIAGGVNIATGTVIWVDECAFHKVSCGEASADLALSLFTRRLGGTLKGFEHP